LYPSQPNQTKKFFTKNSGIISLPTFITPLVIKTTISWRLLSKSDRNNKQSHTDRISELWERDGALKSDCYGSPKLQAAKALLWWLVVSVQSVLVGHTRSHLHDANATRLAMSLQKNTLCKVVGHECGQDLIGMLASLPDPISGALQGLSVRHCVHHVCCKATQMQLTHKLLVLLLMKRELKENRVCSEERRSFFLSSGWIERERDGGHREGHREHNLKENERIEMSL
jgi:hypothetical protein